MNDGFVTGNGNCFQDEREDEFGSNMHSLMVGRRAVIDAETECQPMTCTTIRMHAAQCSILLRVWNTRQGSSGSTSTTLETSAAPGAAAGIGQTPGTLR